MSHDPNDKHHHQHHILSDKAAFTTFGALIVLTVVTVLVAKVDLGSLNLVVALLVASVKATLVAAIFMGLKYDKKENAGIFISGFVFLFIFIGLLIPDVFFRGDSKHKYGTQFFVASAGGPSKFQKQWVGSPELVAHGKAVYAAQCVSCHGAAGEGNGPAAGSLDPKPRNFLADAGWKNGRRPSEIHKTLMEGISGGAMASYSTLSSDDLWGLSHYVNTLGANPPGDDAASLAKVGIDTSKEDGGVPAPKKTLPIDYMMERVAVPVEAGT
jgi:caa(3)-type oxidase subunit IV